MVFAGPGNPSADVAAVPSGLMAWHAMWRAAVLVLKSELVAGQPLQDHTTVVNKNIVRFVAPKVPPYDSHRACTGRVSLPPWATYE